jgi:hypothetical protein
MKDVNVRRKTLKLVQERAGNTLRAIGTGTDFLRRTQEVQQQRQGLASGTTWYLSTMEFFQSQRRMKFCHLQVNRWKCRTLSEAKLLGLRRPKVASSPSLAYCRPKTNPVISLDVGHTLMGDHTLVG